MGEWSPEGWPPISGRGGSASLAIVFRDTELTVVKDSTLVAPEPTLMVTEPLVLAGVVGVGALPLGRPVMLPG